MSYWHQDDDGQWRFDGSHLWPLAPLALIVIVNLVEWLFGIRIWK